MRPKLTCKVEILSIGNELLLGNTLNTNASWLATQLTSLGASVSRITAVPDDMKQISTAVRESMRRKPNFLIMTGGIGPTFDDMTLAAVAKAFHMPLKVNKEAVAMVREHYARRFPAREIKLTRPRLKMTRIPSRAVPLRNPVGTAPGVQISVGSTQVFCLPGVPKEAKAIFRKSVANMVRVSSGGMKFEERWLDVRGVMESTLAPTVEQVMAKWPGIYIKSHPRGIEAAGRPLIHLHLSISSTDSKKAQKTLHSAMDDLARHLRRSKAGIGLR